MPEVYAKAVQRATANRPERRGVSRKTVIEAAKEAVTTPQLAERLSGPGVRRGREIAFRCPLHDDHAPSLRVDPEQGVWFCDPCLVGGDVIELARRAWDYDKSEVATAAAALLYEFGHPLPERPPSWFARQERQAPVRDRLEAERIEHVRMLLFRLLWMPWLRRLPEWAREETADSAWAGTLPLARQLYSKRRDS